jgi:hypothetical protein
MDFLKEVEEHLDLSPEDKASAIRKLRSRYADLKYKLIDSGMNELDAAWEAERRLGRPDAIASKLMAEPRVGSWTSAFLAALPFAAIFLVAVLALVVQSYYPKSFGTVWIVSVPVIAAVVIIGSIRALAREQRTDWLATWMAVTIVLPFSLFMCRVFRPEAVAWDYVACIWLVITIGGAAIWSLRSSVKLVGVLALAFTAAVWWPLAHFISPWLALVLGFVLLSVATLKLFAGHEYGNSSQSALFLFILAMLTPTAIGFFWDLTRNFLLAASPLESILDCALIALTVVLYVRMPTKRL